MGAALKDLQASSEQNKEEQAAKIVGLENECKAMKTRSEEETKSNEERVANLEAQAAEFKDSINAKNKATAELQGKLTETEQTIEKYKNNETALNAEISSLKEQFAVGQEVLTNKEKEFEESMSKLQGDMDSALSAKEETLSKVRAELND